MRDFEIVEKPPRPARRSQKWFQIAAALQADRTKAVFIPANGKPSHTLRTLACTCLRSKLPQKTTIHTRVSPEGVTVWLDEEGDRNA